MQSLTKREAEERLSEVSSCLYAEYIFRSHQWNYFVSFDFDCRVGRKLKRFSVMKEKLLMLCYILPRYSPFWNRTLRWREKLEYIFNSSKIFFFLIGKKDLILPKNYTTLMPKPPLSTFFGNIYKTPNNENTNDCISQCTKLSCHWTVD